MQNEQEKKRQELAIEVMKIFLLSTARHRRMTLINRIKFYLGRKDYKAAFDYDMNDVLVKSFFMADAILSYKPSNTN